MVFVRADCILNYVECLPPCSAESLQSLATLKHLNPSSPTSLNPNEPLKEASLPFKEAYHSSPNRPEYNIPTGSRDDTVRCKSPIALVLDRKSLDEGQIIGWSWPASGIE